MIGRLAQPPASHSNYCSKWVKTTPTRNSCGVKATITSFKKLQKKAAILLFNVQKNNILFLNIFIASFFTTFEKKCSELKKIVDYEMYHSLRGQKDNMHYFAINNLRYADATSLDFYKTITHASLKVYSRALTLVLATCWYL